MWATEANQRDATADGSWMAWTLAGMVGIWVAAGLISFLAPDMVTGSEQEHLPVAAFSTWLWALIATGGFIPGMGKLRGDASRRPIWVGLAVATVVLWLVASVLSIALPAFVTGTDPTVIPLGALVSPLAAAVLTSLAGTAAGIFSRPPTPDRQLPRMS
jgi:hypothetical protein